MKAFRSVLSIPGSPRLFASALVGRLPQGMAGLAILLLVRDTTHSYAAAGAATGAFALATALMAPVQGRLVDRFGRTRVITPTGIGQGVMLVAIVLAAHAHAGAAVLVVLAGLAGALLPPIAASVRALLGEVIPTGVLDTAYALESVSQELVWIAGPLVVALVVGVSSPSAAVLVLAAVCAGGSVVFVRSPLARGRPPEDARHERVAALSSATLRAMLPPIALVGVGLGAIEVGLPSLALHAGSRWASGLLLALWSVGSLAGGLWYGARNWRSSLVSRYRVLLVVALVFSAPLIAARSIPAGIVCSLLAGMAIAPMFSSQYALIGRIVTTGSETEAFTWVAAALVSGLALGEAGGGAVIGSGGVSAPFVLSCAAWAMASVCALRVRGLEPQAAPAR
jgi:MFS-type transporter involved in bile tolerance (Atg22 family)